MTDSMVKQINPLRIYLFGSFTDGTYTKELGNINLSKSLTLTLFGDCRTIRHFSHQLQFDKFII